MKRSWGLACACAISVLLVLGESRPAVAHAQFGCRTDADTSTLMLSMLKNILSHPAAAAKRDSLGLTQVDTSNVTVVTADSSVCASALSVYNAAIAPNGPVQSVYVFRIATSGYHAADPAIPGGTHSFYGVTMTTAFQFSRKYYW